MNSPGGSTVQADVSAHTVQAFTRGPVKPMYTFA